MAKLNLGLSPRQRGRPLERRGVAILVGQADGLVARRASASGTNDVCTNRLENAGWAASDAGGASTISAYDVTSISRGLDPRLVSETRRTSASSSGDTITVSVAAIPWSRRAISARSSENA